MDVSALKSYKGTVWTISRTEIIFSWKFLNVNPVTFTAEYGNSVASAYWIDAPNKMLWLRFNAIPNMDERIILRKRNPYTVVGRTTETAPANAVFTDYKIKFNEEGDTNTVKVTGDQTVGGVKTFNDKVVMNSALLIPQVNSKAVTTETELGIKAYANNTTNKGFEFRCSATVIKQCVFSSVATDQMYYRYSEDNGATWTGWKKFLTEENTGWV